MPAETAAEMSRLAGIGAMTRPLPPALVSSLPDLRSWLVSVYLAGLRPVR